MAEGLLQTARAVSKAALAVDGVHALGTGTFAEAATYEGGEKVTGVVVEAGEVEVHVILDYPLVAPIPELARSIEERVSPLAEGKRINVVVQDLAPKTDDSEEVVNE